MSDLEQGKVPNIIEIFYQPKDEVDEIDMGHREFCIEILRETGYMCVAGCVGSRDATVGDLANEARYDAIGVADAADPDRFVTGPHPTIGAGVGIWTPAN